MAGYYAEIHVHISGGGGESSGGTTTSRSETERRPKNRSRAIAGKTIGLALGSAMYVNSAVGNYTGNKLRQSNTQTSLSLIGSVSVGALSGAKFGPYGALAGGAIALVGVIAKNTINLGIRQINSEQEMLYKTSITGKMTTSGSRWKGEYR